MSENINFTTISPKYENTSIVQKGAADTLFSLLNIQKHHDVLDAGCGPGNLTKKISELTEGRVAGIDPSEGMISEAKKKYDNTEIEFYRMEADDINFKNEFDVIFCNSTFQWFKDPLKSVRNFYQALRKNGIAGIQAPGGKKYCMNFLNAIERIKTDPQTKEIFYCWTNPFFMRQDAEDYSRLFREAGFKVKYSRIHEDISYRTPGDVYTIFASGAIAGYLNQEYYTCALTPEYKENFKNIVREEFQKQAGPDGYVELIFNRIYLTAVKE